MQTTIVTEAELGPAVEALRAGHVVAFPTETVYGLGANGLSADACRKVFEAKGRPEDNPLILHVLGLSGLAALTSGPVPPLAAALVDAFWPGPLTVVVPAAGHIPRIVRAGLETVAVRAPSHTVARALIDGLNGPIAAPSANLSGRPSPTTAQAVYQDMNGRISYIIDGGPTTVGVESTVVDCTTNPVTLLRPGGVSLEMLASVLGEVVVPRAGSVVRSPGMKYRHYAPNAPVVWIRSTDAGVVNAAVRDLAREYGTLGVAAPEKFSALSGPLYRSLGPNAVTAAHRLFQALRALDEHNPDAIVVVWDSDEGLGLAISNRLEKAAGGVVAP